MVINERERTNKQHDQTSDQARSAVTLMGTAAVSATCRLAAAWTTRYGDPQSPEPNRPGEIVEAYLAWQARIEAAEVACGLARAKVTAARLRRENERLRRLIILSSAATTEGVLVKFRVARWCLGDAETYAANNAEAFKEQPYGDHLVVSAAADLIRMVNALGAYVRPAEVAEIARAA